MQRSMLLLKGVCFGAERIPSGAWDLYAGGLKQPFKTWCEAESFVWSALAACDPNGVRLAAAAAEQPIIPAGLS